MKRLFVGATCYFLLFCLGCVSPFIRGESEELFSGLPREKRVSFREVVSLPFKSGVLNAGGIPRALRVIGELPRGGSFPKPFLYSGALRWDVIEKHAGNLSVTFFQEVWTLRDVRALLLRISYSHAFLGKKKRNTPCFLWSNNCSGLLTIVQDKTLLVTDSGRLSYDECSGILWLGRADCNAKKGGQWICLSLSNGSEGGSFNTPLA